MSVDPFEHKWGIKKKFKDRKVKKIIKYIISSITILLVAALCACSTTMDGKSYKIHSHVLCGYVGGVLR